MRVVPVPCLKDNYAYLVICEASKEAAVVDPSEAPPVLAAAAREGVRLRAVWNTHHHWDHVGGNEAIATENPGIEIVAHESDRSRVPGQTRGVTEGDRVSVGDVTAEIIHNPGHTSGAVSYVISEPRAVFTGDTLFGAGCGRVFEGTHAEMRASLDKLAALPADTAVYFGHEYTDKNLRFSSAAEPDNAAVKERHRRVQTVRAAGDPSVPSTIAEELDTNPFLRTASETIVSTLRERGESDTRGKDAVFAALRRWKDSF